jgi:hypothetical protein
MNEFNDQDEINALRKELYDCKNSHFSLSKTIDQV